MGNTLTRYSLAMRLFVFSLTFLVSIGIAGQAFAADVTVNASNDSGNTTDTTAVTLTASDDDYTVTTADNNTAVTHGTGNITLSGGTNDIIVEHADAGNDSAITVKVNGNIDNQTGSLTVRHIETSAANATAVLLEVTGTTSIATTTAVQTSGTDQNAANSATLTLGGNATLTGAVSVTAQGSGNAGSDATINFNGETNATGAITLNSATGQAILNFGHTAAASTHSGTIDGAASEEGDLNVITGATNAITFASNIGSTQRLAAINIGTAVTAGNAVFTGDVAAEVYTINAAEGDSSADFNGDLLIADGDFTADAGDGAGEDVTITIAGNVTVENANQDAILMDNNSGAVTLTFDGSSAQTINARIDGVGGAEGTVNVNNASGVTFEAEIGASQDIAAVVVGSVDGANSIANLTDDSGATAWTLGNGGSTVDTATLNIDSDDATLTIAGTINGTTDTETINITDTGAGAAGNAVTFSGVIGGTTAVDTIAIGSSTLSGNGDFDASVTATNLTLTTGDAAGETAVADFASGTTATITNITLTGGAANANQDATLTVTDAIVAATTITLDDGAAGQAAIDVNTAADRAFGGTIDGGAAGEGALTVDDSDNGAAANTVTFSSNVGATNSLLSVNVGSLTGNTAGSATFDGTLDVTTLTLEAGNAANEATAATVTGALTATTINVTGTDQAVAVASTLTASSTISATTINLLGGAGGAAATAVIDANGAVTATNIIVDGGANDATADATFQASANVTSAVQLDDNAGQAFFTLDGAAAQTVTGAITGVTDGDGQINVTNTGGLVTFASKIGDDGNNDLDTISISANATASFANPVTMDNDFTVAAGTGTITVDAAVTVGDELSFGDGVTVAVDSSLGAGNTVFATTSGNNFAVADNDGSADVTITMPSNFQSGTMTFINNDLTLSNSTDEFAVTDTALVDYTFQANGGDASILEIVASRKSASVAAAELGVTEAAASAYQEAGLAVTSNAAISQQLTDALAAGGTTARDAAETLQNSPGAMSAAGGQAVAATGGQVISVGSTRLASLRSGSQFASSLASGFAAGEGELAKALWIKPFVNFGDQSQRTGIAGYETDTYGTAFGGDVKIGKSHVGLSFSYANTDIDGDGPANAQTDIDSYQGTLYADYTTEKWYVEGLIGYARNEISGNRTITATNGRANAEYGSNQYMFNIGGGMPMKIAENHFITPNASFQYTLVDNETYTETGAGLLNLRVDQDEVHVALGKFGARYHTSQAMESGTFTPEIRTALLYDFAGDEGQSTSVFNGGGAAFSVQGADVVQLGYTAGLGLSYNPISDQGLTISANYDWNQKTDFVGHSANFALRYEF